MGAADGFEGGEAVLNLGDERSVLRIRNILRARGRDDLGEDKSYADAMAGWDSGNACAGGAGIGRDGDGVDEAEVDDVEGDTGVIAVAEGCADAGFGEGGGWNGCGHWLDDSGSRVEVLVPGYCGRSRG